jgi:hypothetical protein
LSSSHSSRLPFLKRKKSRKPQLLLLLRSQKARRTIRSLPRMMMRRMRMRMLMMMRRKSLSQRRVLPKSLKPSLPLRNPLVNLPLEKRENDLHLIKIRSMLGKNKFKLNLHRTGNYLCLGKK